jgi:predicted dehydrogenase
LLGVDLDAVIVTSPHHLHFMHASAALRRGLHVMCEKPVSLDAHNAWELARLAAEGRLVGLVPFGWNYSPFVTAAKRWIDAGLLGEIEHVSCVMASPTKDFFAGGGTVPSTWTPTLVKPDPRTWQTPGQGGGYAHGQLTHATALLFWLTDLETTRVSALMRRPNSAVDMYDAAFVEFGNGATGSLSGSATLPDDDKFQIDLRIFGSAGVLLLDVERERAVLRRHDGHHEAIDVPAGEGAYRCDIPVHRFVELISGAPADNNSPLEVAARTVELIEAMHASAANDGTAVRINRSPDHSALSRRPA